MMQVGRWSLLVLVWLVLTCAGCQSTGTELSGLAEQPPLDYAVLVTGGAFLDRLPDERVGTFAVGPPAEGMGRVEPLSMEQVLSALQAGVVFQRVVVDPDDDHRARILQQLKTGEQPEQLLAFLQSTRDQGYDLMLVIEQLTDAPILGEGINNRWPVTLATWLLLGVGMFIPDHTFESGASLRFTLRDLQTGAVLYDQLLFGGPVDLSMVERTNFLGILTSVIVPPFWVYNDDANVNTGVRDVVSRRLLTSLARDLKSELARQRLRENAIASMSLADRRLVIDAAESLTTVRLRSASVSLPAETALAFERRLLASMDQEGARFVYQAQLPDACPEGLLQVLAETITGDVASATLVAGGSR